jgi:hypothetical protein
MKFKIPLKERVLETYDHFTSFSLLYLHSLANSLRSEMSNEEIEVFCSRVRKVYTRFNDIKQKRENENQTCNSLEAEFVIAYIILYLDTLFPNGKCLTGPADKAKLALSHQNFQTNANWKIINKTDKTQADLANNTKHPQPASILEDGIPTNKILDLWDTSNHLCIGLYILPIYSLLIFL